MLFLILSKLLTQRPSLFHSQEASKFYIAKEIKLNNLRYFISINSYSLLMKNFLLPIILLFSIASCTSIVSKSNYPVSIGSSPEDAKFTITNEYGMKIHSGRTPAYITLAASSGYFKKANYIITYKKRGYDEKTYRLTSTLDGWYWGNILFGGLIGMLIVDPLTGTMYKLPKAINVSLEDSRRSENNGLKIINIDNLSVNQKSKLVRIN